MKIKDLKPNPNNPRTISDKKIAMLAKSLKEFGDLSGIVFNKKTGQLVGGHQRLKALPTDSIIVMDTKTHGYVDINGDRFSYRVVDWDETKEKAANIAANKHGGEWDLHKLSEWLLELDTQNIDMDLTGFDEFALVNLLASGDKPTDPNEEWEGMPEFAHEDQTAFRSLKIHFSCDEHVKKFAELIKQTITDKTRYIWFPPAEVERYSDKRY